MTFSSRHSTSCRTPYEAEEEADESPQPVKYTDVPATDDPMDFLYTDEPLKPDPGTGLA